MNQQKNASDLAKTIENMARQDRGRLLAILIKKFRNFDLAEEALQEAFSSAQVHSGRVGLPSNPQGWLLTVASRKVIDHMRQTVRDTKVASEILTLATIETDEQSDFPDERLRLIFTCCHPAIEPKSRVALTLRTLGGLTTPEIARAFLDNETTMGQRLSRAKAKIVAAGISYAVPGPEELPERLNSVLNVIYLIFNEGYFASAGETPVRQSLCDEAIYLGRMINALRPAEPEILGLLALMLFTNARQRARMSETGVVPLEAQDHSLWDRAMMIEADAVLNQAMATRTPGPYQIQAAITALHCQSGPKDWHQIVLLYDSLLRFDDNPVIRLNRIVAFAELGFLKEALRELVELEPELHDYQPFHAAHADLLAKSGQKELAKQAYGRAINMATNSADAAFLTQKRDSLSAI